MGLIFRKVPRRGRGESDSHPHPLQRYKIYQKQMNIHGEFTQASSFSKIFSVSIVCRLIAFAGEWRFLR